jgi:hypothetical protein
MRIRAKSSVRDKQTYLSNPWIRVWLHGSKAEHTIGEASWRRSYDRIAKLRANEQHAFVDGPAKAWLRPARFSV